MSAAAGGGAAAGSATENADVIAREAGQTGRDALAEHGQTLRSNAGQIVLVLVALAILYYTYRIVNVYAGAAEGVQDAVGEVFDGTMDWADWYGSEVQETVDGAQENVGGIEEPDWDGDGEPGGDLLDRFGGLW